MKRTPLKRKSTLKRTQMRRWPKRNPTPPEDLAYMDRVRRLPCCARHLSQCSGRITAHHAGKKPGMRIKADVSTCIPLCAGHHMFGIESFSGVFRDWTREQARKWQDEQIEKTREDVGWKST